MIWIKKSHNHNNKTLWMLTRPTKIRIHINKKHLIKISVLYSTSTWQSLGVQDEYKFYNYQSVRIHIIQNGYCVWTGRHQNVFYSWTGSPTSHNVRLTYSKNLLGSHNCPKHFLEDGARSLENVWKLIPEWYFPD